MLCYKFIHLYLAIYKLIREFHIMLLVYVAATEC